MSTSIYIINVQIMLQVLIWRLLFEVEKRIYIMGILVIDQQMNRGYFAKWFRDMHDQSLYK